MDIKEKISKVMKQAVDHCEVMGVNIWVNLLQSRCFLEL